MDQVKTELLPADTVAGCDVNWMVGPTWFTVTIVLAVAVPLLPLAVMVYVVVCVGVTVACPLSGRVDVSSWGSEGEIVTEVALVLDHMSVANCPAEMVAGVAWIVAET